MAALGQTFEAESLPQSTGGGYDPLPAGWYNASIASAEVKQTASGTGEYIKVRYDITGPTHQGRVVFGNLNIKNASTKAEEIGRQQLGEIMRALGLARVSDTDQLLGGSLSIKLDIRPATEQYGAQNEVKGFKAVGGASTAPMPSKTAPAASGGRGSAPPWAKK
jgi:hypothetical protein